MTFQRKPQFFRLAHAIQMFVYTSRFYAEKAVTDDDKDVRVFQANMALVVSGLIANGTIMKANVICDRTVWGLAPRERAIPCAKFQVAIDFVTSVSFEIDFTRGADECLFDLNELTDPEVPINPFHVEFIDG